MCIRDRRRLGPRFLLRRRAVDLTFPPSRPPRFDHTPAQTEKDFAEIAGAGLNWVRIPFGWWAIETWDGEPFLAGVAWECACSTLSLFGFFLARSRREHC